MEIPNNFLPDDFDRLISINLLALDPYNVREEQPTDDLVESIRKYGFRKAVIVWPRPDVPGRFWVNDGWQRVGAGVRAGWTEIPCKIYPTALEAMDAAQIESLQRPWTKYQRIKSYMNYYDACRKTGMSHSEAIRTTATNNPGNEDRVERYIRIGELPLAVRALIKQPVERTQSEWNELEKSYSTIRQKTRILGIYVADAISRCLQDFPESKKIEAAIGVLEFNYEEALKVIKLISKYPESSPMEIIQEYKMGYGPDEMISVGTLIVNPVVRQQIREHCSKRRIYIREFIVELINSWFTTKRGDSPEIFELLKKRNGGINEVSFKIGNRKITISSHYGLLMIIEGNSPLFFNKGEITVKAWNSNVKIPNYLKNFLNELNIEL